MIRGVDNWFVTNKHEYELFDKLYETEDSINIVTSDYRTHEYHSIANS